LGVIARLADSVAVMFGGQIVEQATVAALFARPLHPYTQALMNARRSIGLARRRRLPLSLARPAIAKAGLLATGCGFAGRCPHVGAACRLMLPRQAESHAGSHWVRCHNVAGSQLEAL
ncbi:MAG: oligopeptide/dipeptide ABC transporter ATP-binding protein, partial [Sporomusa sp.]